jgi:peptidoglycan/xylan/chitin deacetylase (PgdA/CDA1 family)
MYHDVYEQAPAPGMPRTAGVYHVSRDTLRRHLEAIQRCGLPVLTARESLAATNSDARDHVVITFDDGWEESLGTGVDCLLEAGLRATFFVTSDYVGAPRFADAELLREARRAGMEVGSHGYTHRRLAELSAKELDAELRNSKVFLEELLQEPVETASVPGGSWNAEVARAARRVGYVGLCTSRPGVNREGDDPFRIRRLTVRSGTSAATVERWSRFSVAGPVLRSGLRWVPHRLLGAPRYAALRRRLLRTSTEADVVPATRRAPSSP